jgi:hypothetical protein
MAKKTRPRTARREEERAARQLVRDRQRLAALEPGGSRDRPIEVTSPSVIAVRVRNTPCPLCGDSLRLEEERAESAQLRTAAVRCSRCGVPRTLCSASPRHTAAELS